MKSLEKVSDQTVYSGVYSLIIKILLIACYLSVNKNIHFNNMQFHKIAFALVYIFAVVFADYNLQNPQCESKFCEEDPNYPEKILNSMQLWKYKFDSTDNRIVKRSSNSDAVFIKEENICESKVSFVRPQKLKSVSNQLKTVVNHHNYTQTIKFVTCSSLNFPCTFNYFYFPNTVRSFCRQKYAPIKLLAYHEQQNSIVTEEYPEIKLNNIIL